MSNKVIQSLVSFGIRVLVIAAVAGLDYVIKNISSVGLPDPGITVPLVGLVLSEADTWLVDYEAKWPTVATS